MQSEARASLSKGQEMATQAYGRDIKHVMLLHVGAFQIVMLPRLLELLDQRGFELVTLEEAQSDPAYADDPGLPFAGGSSFLQQVITARSLPPMSFDRPTEKLAALCR